MAQSITAPTLRGVIMDSPRERWKYANGARTDQRVINDAGHTMSTFTLYGSVRELGAEMSVTVWLTDDQARTLPAPGTIVEIMTELGRIEQRGAEYGEIASSIRGVKGLQAIGVYADLIWGIGRTAAKA